MVIHVRSITNAEGNRLRTIVRHPKDPIELRRAQVVLSSAQGFTPPYIVRLVGMSSIMCGRSYTSSTATAWTAWI
jgi:hypothetical protein